MGSDLIGKKYDAVVVGSGPNGLAAAITIAQAGRTVLLLEGKETIGGGTRTLELTLPGFRHDVCSAIHPLALASPFFRSVDLRSFGLEWIKPPVPLAHPLDDEEAVLLESSVEATADKLGSDAEHYRNLIQPVVGNWENIVDELLRPLRIPRHPFALLGFGPNAMRSAMGLAKARFVGKRARALFAGNASHSIMPLESGSSAAFGIMLSMLGHAVGWPIAKGGSQAIADALAGLFKSKGGEIDTGLSVSRMDQLPIAKFFLFDVTPRQLGHMVGLNFSESFKERLRQHRYGEGVFKIDWALKAPIPWRDSKCMQSATVHVGGTLEEIARSERQVGEGIIPEKPFVLLSQASLFDKTRAPEGMHTGWAYCHVPNGSKVDMASRIEDQIERFAPGFKDLILARHTMNTAEMEIYNPNYVGGDIVGGPQGFSDIFLFPLGRFRPYTTPDERIYICSSSMPPGGGVHGMCGYWAAKEALRRVLS